jgi:hypothetical protein
VPHASDQESLIANHNTYGADFVESQLDRKQFARFSLLGLPLNALTKQDLVELVDQAVHNHERYIIGHHNLHSLYVVHREEGNRRDPGQERSGMNTRQDEEVHSMWSGLEKRLARLEKRMAERIQEAKICNCRAVTTRFHNAECLAALLKGMPLVCPVHGLRHLGRFMWTPKWALLRTREGGDDNQFCPCPPHPWRSFVLSSRQGAPHTWEESYAAREASVNLPPDPILDPQEGNRRVQENARRIDAMWEEYCAACQLWVEKSGRRLPTRQEIVKLGREGVPKFVGR